METVTEYRGCRIVTVCSEGAEPRSAGYRVVTSEGEDVAHGAVHGKYGSERAAQAAALAAAKKVVDGMPRPSQF